MKSFLPKSSILRSFVFWKLQLSFWSVIIVCNLLGIGLFGGNFSQSLTPGIIIIRILIGLILSTVAAAILEWLEGLRIPYPNFVLLVGLVTLSTCTVASIFGYRAYVLTTHQEPPGELVLTMFLARIASYSCWTFLFLKLVGDHRRKKLEEENQQTELYLLRTQVNPHFLFNSLNAIVAEANHPQKVKQITSALSEYLRFSVNQSHDAGSALLPLRLELNALKDYLVIHQIRFEEKLVSSIDASEEALAQPVPQALIQPILENAINYGQRTSPVPLVIRITAQLSEENLIVTIENSGHWIEVGTLGSTPSLNASTGTGLRNLRRRLELIYGARASLTIEKGNHQVVVRVILPTTK